MSEENVESVVKEMNYVESNFTLHFKSMESFQQGIKFIEDTVNEWTDNGKITIRKAILNFNQDQLEIGVTMRIEGDDDSIEDINI